MTDKEIIMNILADRQWHNAIEISQRGKPNCINWAFRSRISDLNRFDLPEQGLIIVSEIDKNGCAKYRLEEDKKEYKFIENQGVMF